MLKKLALAVAAAALSAGLVASPAVVDDHAGNSLRKIVKHVSFSQNGL